MARRAQALMREAFEKWDTDGNGTISKQELSSVLRQLGAFPANQIEVLMAQADKNGNGQIEYVEFVDWLLKPVVTVGGAAALYSTAALCVRAESDAAGKAIVPAEGGEAQWDFEGGPLELEEALALPKEHTVLLWVLFSDVCIAPFSAGSWSQLCGDQREGWGLSFGVNEAGCIGIHDPRLGAGAEGKRCVTEPTNAAGGTWAMICLRGICETPTPGPKGCTEVLIANDDRCVRLLGSVDAVAAGLVLDELGSRGPAVSAASCLAAWPRLLADAELRELFLLDGVRYGCLTESKAAWLRLNRREVPERTAEEEETLAARLKEAATGKVAVLDVTDLKIQDSDLKRVLGAVEAAFDGVSALLLSKNYITEDGVKAHLVPFIEDLFDCFRIDLRDNPDINCDAGPALAEAVRKVRPELGVSIDTRGTGLKGEAVMSLLNQSPETQSAALAADRERKRSASMCADFDAKQAAIAEGWADQTDPPVEAGSSSAPASPPFEKFPDGDKEKLRELRAFLARSGGRCYDHRDGENWSWPKALPLNCGSGQLMAHFSYLSKAAQLRAPEDFKLRLWRPDGESEPRGDGVLVHDAVANGRLRLTAVTGKSYGKDALSLKLESRAEEPLDVVIPAGAIFQHVSWAHRQNLMVGRAVRLQLAPGESKEAKVGAFCMNLSCGCSADDPMQLTALMLADRGPLASQGKVWDHFEGLFAKYRAEAGFSDDAKKKGKGGKAKKGKKK